MSLVLPCVLGWSNPDPAPESYRLYALDAGPNPRWLRPPFGRVAEQGIREADEPAHEGDRFLLVRVGDRFDGERMLVLQQRIEELLDEQPPKGLQP